MRHHGPPTRPRRASGARLAVPSTRRSIVRATNRSPPTGDVSPKDLRVRAGRGDRPRADFKPCWICLDEHDARVSASRPLMYPRDRLCYRLRTGCRSLAGLASAETGAIRTPRHALNCAIREDRPKPERWSRPGTGLPTRGPGTACGNRRVRGGPTPSRAVSARSSGRRQCWGGRRRQPGAPGGDPVLTALAMDGPRPRVRNRSIGADGWWLGTRAAPDGFGRALFVADSRGPTGAAPETRLPSSGAGGSGC